MSTASRCGNRSGGAIQQRLYFAAPLKNRPRRKNNPPFRYRHRGGTAIIGRASGVANSGRLRFDGFVAWHAWLFVHLTALAFKRAA